MTPWHLLSLSNYTSAPFTYSSSLDRPPLTTSKAPSLMISSDEDSEPSLYRSRSNSSSSEEEEDEDALRTPTQQSKQLPKVEIRLELGAEAEEEEEVSQWKNQTRGVVAVEDQKKNLADVRL